MKQYKQYQIASPTKPKTPQYMIFDFKVRHQITFIQQITYAYNTYYTPITSRFTPFYQPKIDKRKQKRFMSKTKTTMLRYVPNK